MLSYVEPYLKGLGFDHPTGLGGRASKAFGASILIVVIFTGLELSFLELRILFGRVVWKGSPSRNS